MRASSSPEAPSGVGYLLKDRVTDVRAFLDALRRVAEGESVVDGEVVSQLVARSRETSPLDELSAREREVLALMARRALECRHRRSGS